MFPLPAWSLFLICVLLSFSPVAVSYATGSNDMSQSQSKTKVNVPKIIFPIVWTILYALLSVALFLTLTATNEKLSVLLLFLYITNIALNAAWSPVFVRLRKLKAALLLTLGMILVSAAIVAIHAMRREFLPMALVIPYVAWLTFAAYLQF
jgi:tryptophan-rich sensory protein